MPSAPRIETETGQELNKDVEFVCQNMFQHRSSVNLRRSGGEHGKRQVPRLPRCC